MKRILGIILFVPACALAQTAPPDVQAVTPPQPAAHLLCIRDYPPDAVRNRRVGSVTLLFRVTTEGRVAGVIVASSSGHSDLDSASVACAKTWQYHPAARNGQPVEVPYSASVEWMINGPIWKISLALREPLNVCLASDEDARPRDGETIVAYTLKNGEVTGASIKRSSGNAALDQRAVACVATWHFEPETVDPTTSVTGTLVNSPNDRPAPATRSPESLKSFAATGPTTAKFDWSEFATR